MFNLIKLIDGTPTLTVSVSQLEAMVSCGQFYNWRYIHRRELDRAEGARDAGKAFDAALNTYYHPDVATFPGPPESEVRLAEGEMEALWPQRLPEDEWRTVARYKDLFAKYREHWKDEPFVTEGVQVRFDVPLGVVTCPQKLVDLTPLMEPNRIYPLPETYQVAVRLHGLMDRRVRFRDTGRVAILDTKVKGKWDERRVAVDMQRNGQACAYLYANNLLHPEDNATTFILDAVICREPYRTERGAAANKVPREEFHRPSFVLLPEVVEGWRRNALRWCEDMLRQAASGEWRENLAHCAWHYGGTCPYKDVCNMPTHEQRLRVLESDLYRDYTSPFDVVNGEED